MHCILKAERQNCSSGSKFTHVILNGPMRAPTTKDDYH